MEWFILGAATNKAFLAERVKQTLEIFFLMKGVVVVARKRNLAFQTFIQSQYSSLLSLKLNELQSRKENSWRFLSIIPTSRLDKTKKKKEEANLVI